MVNSACPPRGGDTAYAVTADQKRVPASWTSGGRSMKAVTQLTVVMVRD